MIFNFLAVLSEKASNQRHLMAIRRGLLFCMPLMLLGSFSIMLLNLPLTTYHTLVFDLAGEKWFVFWRAISNGTLGVLSMLLVMSTSYFLAENHRLSRDGMVHPAMIGVVSFACLMVITQPIMTGAGPAIPLLWAGSSGLFIAMLTALLATEIQMRLVSVKAINIRLFSDEPDPVISQALSFMLPATLTLLLFAGGKLVFNMLGIQELHVYAYRLFENLFADHRNTFGTAVLFNVLVHFFWFFGIHGDNMMAPVEKALYTPAAQANVAAFASGAPVTEIFTKPFFDSFVLIGGSGATLCLILAVFIGSKRGNILRMARLSSLPGLFNINEIVLFGLPIVLNPIYLVPFMLTPLVMMTSAYLAISSGLVPPTITQIHWTTPPFLSGYLATGSWKGIALQGFNLFIGVVVYLPFVMLAERQKSRDITHAFRDLSKEVEQAEATPSKQLLVRQDSVGNLSRVLAHDLREAIPRGEMYLEYQPQVDQRGRVVGVEALLRWPHKAYGRIPPPVIIAVAEEIGMIHVIGDWIFRTACRQLATWKKTGMRGIRMGINMSAVQLHKPNLVAMVVKVLKEYNLSPDEIEIEITESVALNVDARTLETLRALHDHGLRIAIDDFGMGHSSLLYIKHFPVDTIKIDQSLSRDVIKDRNCQEIISTIMNLCSSLSMEAIVEYVETNDQREKLSELGCRQYQGYLYSTALPAAEAAVYIRKRNRPSDDEQEWGEPA